MTGRRETTVVTGAMLVIVVLVLTASLPLGPVARRMPLVVAIPTLLLLALELARQTRDPDGGASAKAEAPRTSRRRTSERAMFGWIGILLALVVVVGMAAGVPLFLLAYMRVDFRESWRASLLLPGAMAVMLAIGLQYLLGVPLHPGLIAGWLEAGR